MNATSFHAEIFSFDGELVGTKVRPLSELSAKWLSVCESILEQNGSSFRVSPGQMLNHIEIRHTSAQGSALGMYFVNGVLTVSTAFFMGVSPAADKQVQTVLLESLRDSVLVRHAAASSMPFAAIAATPNRPLCVFIIWDAPDVSEQDRSLVWELSEHFAGAYVKRERDLQA